MIRDDVRCAEVVDVLTEYLDGTLPLEQRVVLEQHLLFCEGCTAFVEQMRTTIGLTRQLAEEDVPPPVMERVLRMVQER